jgi:NADH:ubiquinone oxidoreductase subunit E
MSDLPGQQVTRIFPRRREDGAGEEAGLRERDPLRADRTIGTERQVASSRPSVAAGWDLAADVERDPGLVPDPAETPVPADLRAEVERHMRLYPDHHSAVIPALMAAQRKHGYCSPEALDQVAAVMRVTPAYLSSIVTFYDMLHLEPVGSHSVWVCTSVACHVRQAKRVYEAIVEVAQAEELEDTHIREFECLGACDMAPMASIDNRYVGPLDESDAGEIVAALREGRTPLRGRGLDDQEDDPARLADPNVDGPSRTAHGPEVPADGRDHPVRRPDLGPGVPPGAPPSRPEDQSS